MFGESRDLAEAAGDAVISGPIRHRCATVVLSCGAGGNQRIRCEIFRSSLSCGPGTLRVTSVFDAV